MYIRSADVYFVGKRNKAQTRRAGAAGSMDAPIFTAAKSLSL